MRHSSLILLRALEIACALTSKPKLLLLMDEPTAGMSPKEIRTLMNLLSTLASECAVVLVEHKMKMMMGLCERQIGLRHDELLAEGKPEEDIHGNAEVRQVYLRRGQGPVQSGPRHFTQLKSKSQTPAWRFAGR